MGEDRPESSEQSDESQEDSDESLSESESEETTWESSDEEERIANKKKRAKLQRTKVARVIEKPRVEKNKQSIGKITEVVPNNTDTVELKMSLNGKTVKVILDTGSPISIIPKSMREWIQPKTIRKPPKHRQFVDLNDNEVSVTGIYELDTKLNEKELKLDWREVQSETRPILGRDNFGKLDLRILQGLEEKIGLVEENPEIQKLKDKLAERFENLFNRQGTIRNFKYGVQFKTDFEVFQQKASKYYCTFNQQSEMN